MYYLFNFISLSVEHVALCKVLLTVIIGPEFKPSLPTYTL